MLLLFLAVMLLGQVPECVAGFKVDVQAVELFGVEQSRADSLLELLPLKAGTSPEEFRLKKDIQESKKLLEAVPGVTSVYLQSIHVRSHLPSMPSGAYITIDLVTGTNPYLSSLRAEPTGQVKLSPSLSNLHELYFAIGNDAEKRDHFETEKDGHYWYEDTLAIRFINSLIDSCTVHFDHLGEVVLTSSKKEHRAIAATLLGFSGQKQAAIGVLSKASLDPDGGVRNNAARAMIPIAQLASECDSLKIDAEPFLTMIQFPSATDRNKAGLVLAHIAENNRVLCSRIKQEIGPLVVKMANSKQPNNYFTGQAIISTISGKDYSKLPGGYSAWLKE